MLVAPQPPPCAVVELSDETAYVQEWFIAPKSAGSECEDAVVVTEHFAAVVDGMSSPLRDRGQAPSGRRYAETVAREIARLEPTVSARVAVDSISRALRHIRSDHAGPSGAVAAVYSRAHREIWRIGDVHLRIGDRVVLGEKRVDEAMTLFRAAVVAAHVAAGESLDVLRDQDPGLAASRPLLELQHNLANRDAVFGYGVLDGSAVPDCHLEVFPVADATTVVFASDGYPGPAATFECAERELFAAIERDPACIGELAAMGKPLKQGADTPDDRTYLRFDPTISYAGFDTERES
ncbi:hypothetical protein ERC79_14375 [Rhodococcus sp. ABRD24]|uniref:hypothetical protein n=1 Tax=Rhodococcus sp. ABRD24 TaxID=2507582 RepID=UPI00103D0AA7|nr:hypothetical protein [Rhodococcus sp. ABRD24]QBJ97005.1 hypothetical protein ERC79_14375 [Rhodococcus sp. ABRD24]